MRAAFRSLAGASIALALVVTTSAGAGAKPAPPNPRLDSVSGTGVAEFFGNFEMAVSTGPSGGTSAVGSVSVEGAVSFGGPATCLAVTDNVAVFNVDNTLFGLVTLQVTDNAGSGLPDVIEAIPTVRSPSDCSPLSGGVSANVVSGDITVVDAPPLPTSKAQCREGGYATFGFSNQGRCIAFVVRRARGVTIRASLTSPGEAPLVGTCQRSRRSGWRPGPRATGSGRVQDEPADCRSRPSSDAPPQPGQWQLRHRIVLGIWASTI